LIEQVGPVGADRIQIHQPAPVGRIVLTAQTLTCGPKMRARPLSPSFPASRNATCRRRYSRGY